MGEPSTSTSQRREFQAPVLGRLLASPQGLILCKDISSF